MSEELSRDLTLFHVVMMGMTIGAGVFLGVGISIGKAGPGGLVMTFALNGVVALLSAMSYAELSSAIPRAGGAYNFARIAFGRGPSFLAGWMEWFASSVAGAMYAVTFSIYTLDYLGKLPLFSWLPKGSPVATRLTAAAIALLFIYINYRGASETGKIGAFVTLGQTLFMVILGGLGIFYAFKEPGRLANFQPWMPHGWHALLATMGFTYVAFEGFEVIAQAGDETIDPKRNIPKAMLYSVFFVTLIYVAVSFATVVAVKPGSVEGAPWHWIGSFHEEGFLHAMGRMVRAAPLLPLVAIAAQAVLAVWLVHMSWVAWIIAPLWIGAGVAIYHSYSKSHALATADEIRVLEEEKAPQGDEYRVMVSVANPENALSLVLNTYRLCGAKDARVELLHMVPVPDQVPLADAERYMHEGREAIVEAMLYLAPQFPLSSTIRYCRNVARGIVSAAREKRTNMLILGWHGKMGRFPFRLGSTIDPIIENAPCNVVILKDCRERSYKRVLVPVAGGPNSAFALEIASILADEEEGQVVAFTVAGRRSFDVGKLLADHIDRLHLPPDRVQAKVVAAPDVAAAILAEAEHHDLVVLGCTQDSFLRQLAHNPIPELVASRTDKPVVMVKAGTGIRSWVKRWI